MSLSELSIKLINLINLNIPFESNGLQIIVDKKDYAKLIDNKIPFSLKDSKIFLGKSNQKHKDEKYFLMETIKDLLTESKKFDVSNWDENPNEDKLYISLLLKYKGKPCTMQLYCNKLVLGYYRWTSTINFKSSCSIVKDMLPLFKDGFILMLIAGFNSQMYPTNWTNWTYGNMAGLECQCVGNGKFKFVECGNTYYVNDFEMAISNVESFICL
jgi:hypothetical protein